MTATEVLELSGICREFLSKLGYEVVEYSVVSFEQVTRETFLITLLVKSNAVRREFSFTVYQNQITKFEQMKNYHYLENR